MIENFEMKNGIQTPIYQPQCFVTWTERDRVNDQIETARGTLARLRLLMNLRKLLPFAVEPAEREALITADLLLTKDPAAASDRFAMNMSAALQKRLAKIAVPIERRSMQFAVQKRAAGNRVVSFIASTDGLDRHGTNILPMGIDLSR
jgi:hypothetical protein